MNKKEIPSPSELDILQTILVVDDEVLVRLAVAEYLRDCGYRVSEASNAAEAKAILQSDDRIDLVFSDVQMPGEENGFALARWVREHHPRIKVLLASGLVGAAEKAAEVCGDGPLMAKPYGQDALLRRIQDLLRKAGASS